MTWFSHGVPSFFVEPRWTIGAKTTWAIIAPILPEAADMPWEVARKRVGKHSAGTMNVVALGPVDGD